MKQVENQQLQAFTSSHVVTEVAHRLMTIEAAALFGWPAKVVARLKQQPGQIAKLTGFRRAVDELLQSRIQILTIAPDLLATAAALSQQTGLLSNDALLVAVMQSNGLTKIASNDADFDRVPGITRYSPV